MLGGEYDSRYLWGGFGMLNDVEAVGAERGKIWISWLGSHFVDTMSKNS